ncbi:hypothetical protein LIER_20164 [Lithospermum erythrorhizon]|uniref:Retrotransposon gag domain-containing protein n=1 Tax=Lithospermum erythrorhizon TaxID=34254 RepID=A0AAV3QN85_LITER
MSDQQQIDMAAMHMDGRAEIWLHDLLTSNPLTNWKVFTDALACRFDDINISTIIYEFKKLTQHTSVNDYVNKFEELKGFMISLDRNYDELYWISSFISGLKEELQEAVNMFKPTSLIESFDLTLGHEKQISTLTTKLKFTRYSPKSNFSPSTSSFKTLPPPFLPSPTPHLTTINNNIPPNFPKKLLTPAQMQHEERRICAIIVMIHTPRDTNANKEPCSS